MAKVRSYSVLGTGALGGLYGGLLANAGFDVHFLLRSDFEHVRSHGLKVQSHWGDFHLNPVKCYVNPADMPQSDVVLVCWKTTANGQLQAALKELCGHETIVLVLQNGLDVEKEAAEAVGAERVLGGCCFLCSNKVGPGHIVHLDYGKIAFGEFDNHQSGGITDRMVAIAEDFQAAKIQCEPVEDLQKTRWMKLVWNIPYNGLSVVLSADTKQLMDDGNSAKLAEGLMQEVALAAKRCGSEISQEHIQTMLAYTRDMVPYDSSMRLDYRAGREMEVESIFGNPLRAARAAGYEPHKIAMLYDQLSYLNRANSRQK